MAIGGNIWKKDKDICCICIDRRCQCLGLFQHLCFDNIYAHTSFCIKKYVYKKMLHFA